MEVSGIQTCINHRESWKSKNGLTRWLRSFRYNAVMFHILLGTILLLHSHPRYLRINIKNTLARSFLTWRSPTRHAFSLQNRNRHGPHAERGIQVSHNTIRSRPSGSACARRQPRGRGAPEGRSAWWTWPFISTGLEPPNEQPADAEFRRFPIILFLLLMRRPRWDRTTAACRPSRWRFLILDKTMERPVARFQALLLIRPFHSSSFSRRLPFRSLQQMCTTASRSPSLFFCRAGRTRVTASPCAQKMASASEELQRDCLFDGAATKPTESIQSRSADIYCCAPQPTRRRFPFSSCLPPPVRRSSDWSEFFAGCFEIASFRLSCCFFLFQFEVDQSFRRLRCK